MDFLNINPLMNVLGQHFADMVEYDEQEMQMASVPVGVLGSLLSYISIQRKASILQAPDHPFYNTLHEKVAWSRVRAVSINQYSYDIRVDSRER